MDYELTEKKQVLKNYIIERVLKCKLTMIFFDESYDKYINFIAQNEIDLDILNKSLIPKRLFNYNNSVVGNLISSWDVYLDELSPYFELQAGESIEFKKNKKS